jgi:hypothetical protein
MVRTLSPQCEIAGRIVIGQASRLAEPEPRSEDYPDSLNSAENAGRREMDFFFLLAFVMVASDAGR